jgi:hypothetical protein|tara:strand:- start:15 stop:416 length:402 start_codon:yes stop_codon:yes gene_type:complete
MSIVKSTNSKTANKVPKFNISLGEDSIEFRPTATFAHVTPEQVLKIIAKAQPDVTAENNQGQVNFKFSIKTKQGAIKNVGFVNYYDNDLDDDSSDDEVTPVLQMLQQDLRKVKLSDISLPMTASQADDLIDDL